MRLSYVSRKAVAARIRVLVGQVTYATGKIQGCRSSNTSGIKRSDVDKLR